jgi:hypothetical protein
MKVTVLQEGGYVEIVGRCGDISRGGIGTILTAEVSKGEVVSAELNLPGAEQPVITRSIVRYRRGFLHGLEFLGLSPEQQILIDEFCKNLPLLS